jgi:hypothetical protein
MQTSSARIERAFLVAPLTGLLLAIALAAGAGAQGMRDLVAAALDEKITQRIEISERPIRDALAELEKITGLHFELHQMAIDWMPYGEQTRLSIVMQDMSVRRALERIFGGLGLALRVADDRVMIEPAPVLDRLARRLTVEEVGLLQKLASQPWSALKPDDFTAEFRLAQGKESPQQVFEQAMREGPAVDALTQLESVTQKLGWLWVPAGKTIVIYGRTEDIQQRLDRPLDVNYQRIPLDKMLLDLGKRIGVTVHFEPGALQRVAARDRYIDLVQRGTTVRQVLELIAGNTGLWYDVVDDGIVVGSKPPAGAPGAEPPAEQPQRVVAILRVPVGTDGTTIDFLIRADELPPEFKSLRDRKLPQVIEELRKQAQP